MLEPGGAGVGCLPIRWVAERLGRVGVGPRVCVAIGGDDMTGRSVSARLGSARSGRPAGRRIRRDGAAHGPDDVPVSCVPQQSFSSFPLLLLAMARQRVLIHRRRTTDRPVASVGSMSVGSGVMLCQGRECTARRRARRPGERDPPHGPRSLLTGRGRASEFARIECQGGDSSYRGHARPAVTAESRGDPQTDGARGRPRNPARSRSRCGLSLLPPDRCNQPGQAVPYRAVPDPAQARPGRVDA